MFNLIKPRDSAMADRGLTTPCMEGPQLSEKDFTEMHQIATLIIQIE